MNDGRTPLEHALGDGEDFELAFAVAVEDGWKLIETQPVAGVTLTKIGEFVVENRLWIEENGMRRVLSSSGYVHALE
jgi:thiamine-monophosphate kinase